MNTFFLENFGCRATDADAAAIHRQLLVQGLVASKDFTRADVVVLNTCTVTASADSQAREAVRKIHRANPAARIIVTGCYAQRSPEELASLDGVAYVVGNARQEDIPALVHAESEATRSSGERRHGDFVPLDDLQSAPLCLDQRPAKILAGDIFERSAVQLAPAAFMAGSRTRPILKIQDGCNNRCSYCVIPFVRGRSRSLPPDAVIAEVRELVTSGAKEIVLSGINLGSYGRDLSPRRDLAYIAGRILDETALEQLRFSSIEPQDITEDFVAIVAGSDRLAPHFHVPLQSGSDRILKAMHRWYRSELYAERIELIRRLLPHAAIGADVIVGFPGETDEDFQATFDFIARLPFTYLHVFSFSARPGTHAAKLSGDISPVVIRERARALRSLASQKSHAFRKIQAGGRMRALTLARTGEGWTEALTVNYLKVRIAGRFAANEWHEIVFPKGEELAHLLESSSALKNHFSQRQIAAVCHGERNVSHSQFVGELPRDAFQI